MSGETITIELKRYKTMLNAIETLEKLVQYLHNESRGYKCLEDIFNQCWPMFFYPLTDEQINFRDTFIQIANKIFNKHNIHLSRSVEGEMFFHEKSSN